MNMENGLITYLITKVENGFLFMNDGKLFVYESIDSVAQDLARGVLSRLLSGGKIEFSAKLIDDGTKN